MSRRLTRTYAVANLEDLPVTIPTSAKENKRKHTADDTASEGDDTPEVIQSPPKLKCGRPPAKKKVPENLEVTPLTITTSTKENKQKRTPDDVASEGDDTEIPQSPPKPKHGRPTKKKAAEIAASIVGNEPVSNVAGTGDPKPVIVRGKVLPPRLPQPG